MADAKAVGGFVQYDKTECKSAYCCNLCLWGAREESNCQEILDSSNRGESFHRAALDDQLKRLRASLLVGKGKVSHERAMQKAEHEFEIYRQREMRQLKSDFDNAIKGYLGLGGMTN